MNFGVLDYVTLGIFLFLVIFFTARGFLKSIAWICHIVAAFLIAKLIGPLLGKLISSAILGPAIYSRIEKRVSGLVGETFGKLFGENSSEFSSLLSRFDATDLLSGLSEIYGDDVAVTEESLSALVRDIAEPWVERLSTAIGCAVVFLISFLLLFLVTKLLIKVVEKVSILRRTDHMLGLLIGSVAGVYGIVLLCYLVALSEGLLAFTSGGGMGIIEAVDSSVIFGRIYRFVMGNI